MKKIHFVLAMLFFVSFDAFSDSASEYLDSASIKQSRRDSDGALVDCNKSIKANPYYADAYLFRAEIERKTGDADHAMADYNKAIDLNPSFASYLRQS